MLSTHIYADPNPYRPEGRRVPQYGPEWVAHVTAGGDVHGSVLIGETPQEES